MKLTPRIIFSYNTQHLVYKDKVRFFYALKGRGNKAGIIQECDILQLGKTVLLVQSQYEDKVHAFLKEWKCTYEALPVMMKPEEVTTKPD